MDPHADQFVTQAREHLGVLETVLLSLEGPAAEDPRERVDRCLRIVHSIKGDAGFLGLSGVRSLANAMENVLEAVRDAEGPADLRAVERLLAARDRLANLIDDLEHSNQADVGGLLAELERAARHVEGASTAWDVDLREVDRLRSGRLADFFATLRGLGELASAELVVGPGDLAQGLPEGAPRLRFRLATARPRAEVCQALGLPDLAEARGVELSVDLAEWSRVRQSTLGPLLAEVGRLGRLDDGRLELGEIDLAGGPVAGRPVLRGRLRTGLSGEEVERRLGLPGRGQSAGAPAAPLSADPVGPPARPDTEAPAHPAPDPTGSGSDRTGSLRINVELLDRLMTLTSELTLIRNQSLLALDRDDDRVRPIVQRLDAVTSALQETVLRTRMQPIGNLFGKFPRVVRDLGRQLGKQVEITIVGREVELDKTILEQLSDPLTHLVRNSVDHGVEPPAERLAKGKPAAGRITLEASHEEGQVRIQVRDDGRGIDPQAVREKALALRLKTEAELDRMSPRELYALVLLPGFSTARAVTEVSGRGVGMDVVKTNIELLEGTLAIDSQPGAGTSMVLRMPLTLAIIPCLIVTAGGQRYAVPQRELEEAVCLHPGLEGRVERAFDAEVFRLRGLLLPVVRLADVLARRRPFTAETRAEVLAEHEANDDPRRIAYILVLRTGGRRFGLVVDEVRGTEEIVVKPMHSSLRRVGVFAGATIMGDGRVALIADVAGIAEHARLDLETGQVRKAIQTASAAVQTHRVLLFENGPHEQFALPLLQVRRVEMVGPDRIERVGDHEYVTVDGASLRVLRLDQVMNVSAPAPPAEGTAPLVPLILPKYDTQSTAILATRIVDTESLAVALQHHPEHGEGSLGSAVVRGRMTLFLDVDRLTRRLHGRPPAAGRAGPRPTARLLVVDDTPFFLEIVKRYLTAEGYAVETAVNGRDGLARLASGGPFDLIVSDIEMPVMDGWEFAREARRRGVETRMLALTSLSGAVHENKARDCGFDGYEVKIDHDRLVRKVAELLADRRPAP